MKLRALFLLAGILAVSGCSSQVSAGSPTATRAAAPRPTPTRPAPTPTRAPTPRPALHATAVVAARTAAKSDYDAGEAALKAGQYAAAVKDFRAAIDHHQRVADAYVGLGTAYVGSLHYADAFSAFRHAAALEPRNPHVLYSAAYAALYADDYHSAATYASRYLALKPHDGQGYHLRFLAYGGLLDKTHQLDDARQVARYEPNSPTAFNDLGIALAQNGKYTESEVALSKAIALEPNNWQFYKNRGLAEYRRGIAESRKDQLVAALRDFERAEALTKDPVQRGNLKAAIAYLRKQMHQ
jgi:Flp pilus assembly protein TadD